MTYFPMSWSLDCLSGAGVVVFNHDLNVSLPV